MKELIPKYETYSNYDEYLRDCQGRPLHTEIKVRHFNEEMPEWDSDAFGSFPSRGVLIGNLISVTNVEYCNLHYFPVPLITIT